MNSLQQALEDAELLVQKLKEANAIVQRLNGTKQESSPSDSLTEKQREVYSLIAEGLSMQEIATKLKISKKTAEQHRDGIRKRLGYAKAKDLYKAIRK